MVQKRVENKELKAILVLEGIEKKKTQMRKKWAEEAARKARKCSGAYKR